MSTNAFSGYGGQIKIGSSVVAEVTEWNGTLNKETTDVTPLSSSGWTCRITTRKDFIGSFNCNLLPNASVTLLTDGKAREAEFFLSASGDVAAAKPKILCRIIHSTDITVPAGQVTFSNTFESDGPVNTSVTPL